MTAAIEPTLDALADDWIALAFVGALVLGIVWIGVEIQRLREAIEPLATSPLARLAAGVS